jgi:hypothetical protein
MAYHATVKETGKNDCFSQEETSQVGSVKMLASSLPLSYSLTITRALHYRLRSCPYHPRILPSAPGKEDPDVSGNPHHVDLAFGAVEVVATGRPPRREVWGWDSA